MILEFCAENFTDIPKAIQQGATRIELCDNLAADGTTPSYAVIEHAVKYANEHNATVMTIIRPRGGNFVYTQDELEIMKKDLKKSKDLNSHGVVLGALTADSRIDRAQTKELLDQTGEMKTVFHMAFDHIPKAFQKEEMDWLIEQGVTRILTHGGLGGTIFDHIDWLKELMNHADGKIEILIGGGVTHENVAELAGLLPTDQFHGTKIVDLSL